MRLFALTLAVGLAVGQPAADFQLLDQNGQSVSLSAGRGHKVVLVFYRGYW
jgi:peroxiredoxin